ncbi:MAG: hypothetical protein J5I47_00080 [Vicingus serpentipes]|nr:hypothetical protein [Vicingus serpentipes]
MAKPDTLQVDSVKFHSPTKATLMSVALPGLGQVYNKKYWKVPIIYGGIGTSLYFAISNQKNYKKYRTAYGNRVDGNENTVASEEFDNYTDENLKSNMDFYQRNRDLSYIVAGLFYVLNIVDAAVDAHLFTFPKNDNLSFNLQPDIQLTQNNEITNGLKLVVKL